MSATSRNALGSRRVRPGSAASTGHRSRPGARADRRALLQAGVALAVSAAGASVPVARAASAASEPGTSGAPAELASALPGARLHGEGRFRYFGLTVYDARLWTRAAWSGDDYTRQPFALELLYRRDLAGRAIAERSLDEMRRIGEVGAAQASLWLAAMQAAFPDVRDGDRLTGLHQPGAAVRFFHNGALTREVADAEFARLFFGIWLSPRSSAAALRRALLGLAG